MSVEEQQGGEIVMERHDSRNLDRYERNGTGQQRSMDRQLHLRQS